MKPEDGSKDGSSMQVIEEKPSAKYFNTIKHLQNQISIQKKSMKMQKSVHASYFLEKGELEDFFLDCIEEVKKDIRKRKSQNIQNSKLTFSSSAKSLHKTEEVSLTDFKLSDKKKVVELVVAREEVIKLLQELIFPKNIERKQRPRTGTGQNYGLTHVFSSPGLRDNKNLIRPSTAPKGWN
jgi:hypothetical protein